MEGEILANRYRLLDELGRGGMGTVWRAEDLLTRRDVALKRLRAEFVQDARLRRRLRREARAVARLEHPNIVRLYDMGEDDAGAPFLAMEMVRGRPLRAVGLDTFEWPRLAAYVDQILGALAFAHARGVVHRDLKPDNVVVAKGPQGEEVIKLLDFGFARVEDDSDDQLTAVSKDVFGTPTYMAPEQATGDHEVGPTTDLYSLGVIVWELVTGAPPFIGSSGTAVVVQHVTAAPPPLVARTGLELPAGLEDVLRRALEKEPAQRYDNAGDMRRALAALDDDDHSMTLVNAQPLANVTTGERSVILEPDPADETGTMTVARTLARDEGPLVGRDPLQRWVWDGVVRVCEDGAPRALLLEGPSGVGRTRLLAWLRQTLAEGGWMTVAGGRCRPGDAAGALAAALRAALALDGVRSDDRADAVRAALAQLGDDGRIDGEALTAFLWPAVTGPGPVGRALRVVEQVVRLVAARRPLLLTLDDLHRADGAQLSVLEHLLLHLAQRPAPVLVVATRRVDATSLLPSTTSSDPVGGLLTRRPDLFELREVTRLDDLSMAQLVQERLPLPPADVEHLVRAGRGNPLYVVQALAWLVDQRAVRAAGQGYALDAAVQALPSTLVELMRARLRVALADHGDDLRALVEWLALLGDTFPFGLVEALGRRAGVDVVRLETGLDQLVRAGVLVDEAGDAFSFANHLTREAVLEDLVGRSDAAGLHRRVAETKADWFEGAPGPAAADVAGHYASAGETEKALSYLLVAAEHARETFQFASAGAWYAAAERLAGALPRGGASDAARADILLGVAEIALALRDPQRAGRQAAKLLRWAQQVDDAPRTAAALRLLGEAQVALGRGNEADPALAEAARLLQLEGDARGAARAGLARGRAALQRGALAASRDHFKAARARFAEAGDVRGEAACRRALGELAVRAGDRPTALEQLTEAVRLAERAGDALLLAQASWRLAELLRQGGQVEAAAARYAVAADAYGAAGNEEGVGRSLRGLGDAQRAQGHPEARRTYQQAIEAFRRLGDSFQLAICFTQVGRLATDAGDLVGAEASFERALACLEAFDDPVRVGVLHAFLARIAHRRGDRGARDERLRAALQVDRTRPLVVNEWPRVLEELATGLRAEGRTQDASRLLRRAIEVWTALRRPEDAGRCRTTLSELTA